VFEISGIYSCHVTMSLSKFWQNIMTQNSILVNYNTAPDLAHYLLFGPNQTALDLNEIVLAEEVQISWNTSQ
jgi:hypothetical protein